MPKRRVIVSDEVKAAIKLGVEFEVINLGYCHDVDIDGDMDESSAKWVHEQLEAGNEWAWCNIEVRANFLGFTGTDHLGACSYKSKEDFLTSNGSIRDENGKWHQVGGYYSDMCDEALSDLWSEIEAAGEKLAA